MNQQKEKIEWSALEYEKKEKDTDWLMAFGIIIIASAITSIVYQNYFFAVLIILSGILLYFFAIKNPSTINYELNQDGLRVKDHFFQYKNIKSFYILDKSNKPILLIKSGRLLMPIISIPLNTAESNEIYSFLISQSVLEEEMEQHLAERIMDYFGF